MEKRIETTVNLIMFLSLLATAGIFRWFTTSRRLRAPLILTLAEVIRHILFNHFAEAMVGAKPKTLSIARVEIAGPRIDNAFNGGIGLEGDTLRDFTAGNWRNATIICSTLTDSPQRLITRPSVNCASASSCP